MQIFTFVFSTLFLSCAVATEFNSAWAEEKPARYEDYLPTTVWQSSPPEAQGMASETLARLVEKASNSEKRIHSITIIRNGYMLLDAYFDTFRIHKRHRVYSCTKSVMSALIGIAIEHGHVSDVHQRVSSFFPEQGVSAYDSVKRNITLKHLLTMTSGLNCTDSYLFKWKGLWAMRRSNDWAQHVLNLPMREQPGTSFNYCNGVSHLLSEIIQRSTGMTAFEYAKQSLFTPLGINDVTWAHNSTGVTVGYSDLMLTPHDMAKIGFLYLKQGRWGTQQIIPTEWVRQSFKPHIAATLFPHYGYQWWIDSSGYYVAAGYKGQYIFVLPDHNMVVVFTGALADKHFYLPVSYLKEYIVPAIKSNHALPYNDKSLNRLLSAIRDAQASL